MGTEPHLGGLAVPGAAAAAEVNVVMDSGSGITGMSEELMEVLWRLTGMMQTALTQAFVGHARAVMSLGQECDIVTQSCPLHLTIATMWGPVWFTMPFIVLPEVDGVAIIGQKTLKQKLGIDVMTQLKASVLKADGRQDGPDMEVSAGAVDEPNAGAVLRAAMAVTAFGPSCGAPGDVDDDATLMLLSQRPMMFEDSEVEMQDGVDSLGTAVDDAHDHESPLKCAKMLRDIVFRTHLDVFRPALLGDLPARLEPMTVRL